MSKPVLKVANYKIRVVLPDYKKKKMKFIPVYTVMIFTLMAAVSARGQEITIGQQCPDVVLRNVINYPSETLRLSDFKGKAIVIDFWGYHCQPCIAGFPRLDSLQKELGSQLQVILVTKDEADKVRKVLASFASNKKLRNLQLPVVVQDTVISKIFPYQIVPHQVWLDKNGIVTAITTGSETTRANITALIQGKELKTHLKKEVADYNLKFPVIFNEYDQNKGSMLYYSYISGYLDGLGGRSCIAVSNTKEGTTRTFAMNNSIQRLYKTAYKKNGLPDSRVIYMGRDSLKYKPDYEKYLNLYCFDMIVRTLDREKVAVYMQQELDRAFDLKSTYGKEIVKCLVLKRTSAKDKLASKDTGGTNEHVQGRYILRNNKFDAVFYNNLSIRTIYPVIDETGYTGRVDMEIPDNLYDINKMRAALQQYDLDLVLEERELEIIALRPVQ
jgi:thiol-disulfide isomerase/thioredoxin